MIAAPEADRLARRIRAICDNVKPQHAVSATWRVALILTVNQYGQAQTVEALRDLADLVERDLTPLH